MYCFYSFLLSLKFFIVFSSIFSVFSRKIGGRGDRRTGPLRGQNFCGSRVAGGRKSKLAKIGGRGAEASTQGQVGEKIKKEEEE